MPEPEKKQGPQGPIRMWRWTPVDIKVAEWSELTSIGLDHLNRNHSLFNEELNGIAKAMDLNSFATCFLSSLPGMLFGEGKRVQLYEIYAYKQLNKSKEDLFYGNADPDVAELRDKYISGEEIPREKIGSVSSTKMSYYQSTQTTQSQFKTLMLSQIVLCWTTFET
jgi:hypothetical protein